MQSIHLPLSPVVRMGFVGVVVGACVLVSLSQIAPAWRIVALTILLPTGWGLWRRYRVWRPVTLRLDADASISCMLSSGRTVRVQQVLLGVLNPSLVCARLVGRGGESLDLFVTVMCIDGESHWQLRRALIAWRPPPGDKVAGSELADRS